MSSYMQALKRLRDDPTPLAPRRPTDERRTVSEESAARVTTLAPPSPRNAASPGVAALLDHLRGLAAQGEPARVLVFAPVEPGVAASGLVDALAARARELELPVAVAGLTRSGGGAQLAARGTAPRTLPLDGAQLAPALAGWLDGHAAAQLVLIDAPPVLGSIDALLLGAACDGLVLVAQTHATARRALRDAAARAGAAGCHMLGVVLTHT
jgi:hypothetical protein